MKSQTTNRVSFPRFDEAKMGGTYPQLKTNVSGKTLAFTKPCCTVKRILTLR